MEISRYLRSHARTIAGKAQLFINAFAKALEVGDQPEEGRGVGSSCPFFSIQNPPLSSFQIIPRQLCDNAGFDATDVLNKLRQKHAELSGGP